MSAVKSKVMSLRLDVQELRLHVQGLDLVWVWLYLLLGVWRYELRVVHQPN